MAGRFYPPTEIRREMRDLLLRHLHEHPAEYAADALIQRAMDSRMPGFNATEIKIELSRMVGTEVRVNPNNTLVATDS